MVGILAGAGMLSLLGTLAVVARQRQACPHPPREGMHRTRCAPASFISTRSGCSHAGERTLAQTLRRPLRGSSPLTRGKRRGSRARGPWRAGRGSADLPDIVPTADVKGRGGCLPRGAGIDVRDLEGDVADAGTPETRALTLTEDAGSKLFGLRLLTESATQSQPA